MPLLLWFMFAYCYLCFYFSFVMLLLFWYYCFLAVMYLRYTVGVWDGDCFPLCT